MTPLLPRLEYWVQAVFRRQPACRYCGERDTTVIARKYGAIRIRECPICSLCFTDPAYEPMAGNYYDRLYDTRSLTTRVPPAPELDALKRSQFVGSAKDFNERIRLIRGRRGVGHRWIELGSSWGYFLYQAKSQGIDARGVEIGSVRREYGVEKLGVDIRCSLNDFEPGSADVVYTHHVLEHFLSLSSVFDEIERVLAPGGLLVVEVPNFDLKARGPAALGVIGAAHPMGLNRRFFEFVGPRHGFVHVEFPSSYAPDAPPTVDSSGEYLVVLMRKTPQ